MVFQACFIINVFLIKTPENDEYSAELNDFFVSYDEYSRDTLNGYYGKTAKFWMKYIDTMHLYRKFIRSIRTGNLDAYIWCLPKLSNFFFRLNHPNYARWCIQYHDNLLKLSETHPEVYEEFKRGMFSIKRTNKPFSGSPIDLTVEQTINKDAGSQRSGISSMTNS